ncbi:hypothetical protein C806_00048 [Lachnospiraceae bacterium 3-1]|nr:hypothetical protein C806_00048 [Lachnospiraceae bacterium 3-1]
MGIQKYPEDYRFKCEIEKFKQCVDFAKDLLEHDKLFILFECISEVRFKAKLDKKEYDLCYTGLEYDEFKDILTNEVSVILVQNAEEPELREPNLERYLEKEIADSNTIKEILEEKYQKRKYVKDMLMDSDMDSRYWMKKKTLNYKLSGLNYELNRFVLRNHVDALYATIRIETSKTLKKEGIPEIFMGNAGEQAVSFVCDKQDLEYIIDILKKIKERM